ncbi:hypothetical protein DFH09DRAFT_1368145 [Mycena vulgaris]|nr:hypothetical protein DFH09DRAFT_1368145 [Mycena vulgaris]
MRAQTHSPTHLSSNGRRAGLLPPQLHRTATRISIVARKQDPHFLTRSPFCVRGKPAASDCDPCHLHTGRYYKPHEELRSTLSAHSPQLALAHSLLHAASSDPRASPTSVRPCRVLAPRGPCTPPPATTMTNGTAERDRAQDVVLPRVRRAAYRLPAPAPTFDALSQCRYHANTSIPRRAQPSLPIASSPILRAPAHQAKNPA